MTPPGSGGLHRMGAADWMTHVSQTHLPSPPWEGQARHILRLRHGSELRVGRVCFPSPSCTAGPVCGDNFRDMQLPRLSRDLGQGQLHCRSQPGTPSFTEFLNGR